MQRRKAAPDHGRRWHPASNLELTSYADGTVSLSIVPPSDCLVADLSLVQEVLAHLRVYDGASTNHVKESVEAERSESLRPCDGWQTMA
jgi:hypothetical protein